MALPLTVFKTIPVNTPATDTVIYTAPTGYTAIILTAQAVNTETTEKNFSMNLRRGSTVHSVIFEYSIPSREVLIASGGTAGKLVLQTGDSLSVSGESSNVKFTLSVLETLI
jgi:hypothetical protein